MLLRVLTRGLRTSAVRASAQPASCYAARPLDLSAPWMREDATIQAKKDKGDKPKKPKPEGEAGKEKKPAGEAPKKK